MRKKLVVAGDVDRALLIHMENESRFESVYLPVTTEDELVEAVVEAHILVTRSFHPVTRRVISAGPHLELIAQGTSGTDNIDLEAAAERGIEVVSAPGINANAVAELVLGFMFSLTRTIPFYTREVAGNRWPREDCAARHELRHYRLGIVGLGRVGTRVARAASLFGVDPVAYDPYLSDAEFRERHARRQTTLDALMAGSDIVSLHLPLTAETRRMITAREIALLPPRAILINTSRGEVLDQQAALHALVHDRLGGLALDVFETEPPLSAFPDDARLILTPHIAGCSHESRADIGRRLHEAIVAFYAARD